MTSKKAPGTKTTSSSTKARSKSRQSAQPAPKPETVERYHCNFICVIGFSQAAKEALGPDLLKTVTDELNTLALDIVLQDQRCVVNLSSHILATTV